MDSVDEYGRTAVMYSAMAEREECMELLIKRGASLSPQVHACTCVCRYKAINQYDFSLTMLHLHVCVALLS